MNFNTEYENKINKEITDHNYGASYYSLKNFYEKCDEIDNIDANIRDILYTTKKIGKEIKSLLFKSAWKLYNLHKEYTHLGILSFSQTLKEKWEIIKSII